MGKAGGESKHFIAMLLIGDGVLALVRPHHDAGAWARGPAPWRSLMRYLDRHPQLTRAVGAVQIAGAVWWALQR